MNDLVLSKEGKKLLAWESNILFCLCCYVDRRHDCGSVSVFNLTVWTLKAAIKEPCFTLQSSVGPVKWEKHPTI